MARRKPLNRYDEYAALLDAVRGIRWPARSAVRGGIPGAHTSRLRGISAEFTEYRPYRQGDDTRRIDWKLFARSDRAYIRLSNDRAILPTMIVLDASASMAFPVATNGKWKLAAQIGVALGAVARNSGDPVGLVIAQDEEPLLLPPRMRRSVTHEIIRAVSATRPNGRAALAPSVSIAAQSGGRLVIVTDFLGDAEELLTVASRLVAAGREVHAVHVIAREEIDPPDEAAMVSDPEAPDVRRALTSDTRDCVPRGVWRVAGSHRARVCRSGGRVRDGDCRRGDGRAPHPPHHRAARDVRDSMSFLAPGFLYAALAVAAANSRAPFHRDASAACRDPADRALRSGYARDYNRARAPSVGLVADAVTRAVDARRGCGIGEAGYHTAPRSRSARDSGRRLTLGA